MAKYKPFFLNRDSVVDELLVVLSLPTTYGFNELFEVVFARLKARKIKNLAEDKMRLRTYEKLQMLVAAGLVMKNEKRYSGDRPAILNRINRTEASRAFQEERKMVNKEARESLAFSAELPVQPKDHV